MGRLLGEAPLPAVPASLPGPAAEEGPRYQKRDTFICRHLPLHIEDVCAAGMPLWDASLF